MAAEDIELMGGNMFDEKKILREAVRDLRRLNEEGDDHEEAVRRITAFKFWSKLESQLRGPFYEGCQKAVKIALRGNPSGGGTTRLTKAALSYKVGDFYALKELICKHLADDVMEMVEEEMEFDDAVNEMEDYLEGEHWNK